MGTASMFRLVTAAVMATSVVSGARGAILQPRDVASAAPSVWVSIDPAGKAHTVTPVVTATQGSTTTTISPPPSTLMATRTYTLSPSGHATTVTGLAPVASATASNGAGVFLACQIYQGADAPFCQPRSGTTVYTGRSYYG
jgi:hypothetical protein